jgi:hypothetical protein
MIEHKFDALGNFTGYFDTEKSCWLPSSDVPEEQRFIPPADYVNVVETPPDSTFDSGQAADADDDGEPIPEPDFESMTKQQLLEWLINSGVDVSTKDSKAELLEQAQNTFAAQQAAG